MGVKILCHFFVGTRYIVSLQILFILLSGCAVYRTDTITKIALLTSFEGRYREIGYNALYAAQLALKENAVTSVDLLAVDDGGSIETAIVRAHALRHDSAVKTVLVLGVYATADPVQQAFGELPVIIIGHWNAAPHGQNTVMLASHEIDTLVTLPNDFSMTDHWQMPLIGSEILALAQLPKVQESLSGITVISSASLPDEAFRQRYLAMGQFTPEPGLLATLTYDAVGMTLEAIRTNTSLNNIVYSGMNGTIRFENGYWQNAPIQHFYYDGTQLVLAN